MNGTAAAGHAPATAGIHWPRAVGYGVLWGIAAAALAAFEVPWSDTGSAQLLWLESRLLPALCVQGIVLASAAMALQQRLTWSWALVVVMATGFALLSNSVDWLFWKVLPLPSPDLLPAWGAEPNYCYSAWHNLVYGGLFIAAYRLSVESERSRRLFAEAEIARQKTEAWLGAQRVRALQGHVDPALLLRVMVEVEQRYARDAPGMERLLDALVGMLRAAMPGVRSGRSTLGAELLLAQSYAALRGELEPGGDAWRLHIDGSVPELPFPALMLLPVLDQLIADHLSAVELQIGRADGQCTLKLGLTGSASGPWLTPELAYRVQVGLRTVFGNEWTLAVQERSARHALVLMLPLDAAALVSPALSTRLETTHG